MKDVSVWVLALGFLGQGLFFSRILVQWVASERAKKSVAPRVFWHLSLAGAACVLAYAVLVENFVFAGSIVPGAVISLRNLLIRRPARRTTLVPALAAFVALIVWAALAKPYVGPALWAAIGLTGTALWGARFLVQWWVSERTGRSAFPLSFWVLSLAGSLLLLAYAFYRLDPVMIAAYGIGCVPYVRNMMLYRYATKERGA